jgi:hypothetical protein
MYTYEKYNFRIIILLLILMAGVFLGNRAYTGAIISVAVALLFTSSYQGVKIDAGEKRFMKYNRFFRLRIGRWEPLPEPEYVTMVRINLSSYRTVPSPIVMPELKKSSKAFKVNLVVKDDMRYISICRGHIEAMREEALKLGRLLGVRVLDYSTHEKKWIL